MMRCGNWQDGLVEQRAGRAIITTFTRKTHDIYEKCKLLEGEWRAATASIAPPSQRGGMGMNYAGADRTDYHAGDLTGVS